MLRSNTRFLNRWARQRRQRLLKEDLRDLTRVNEITLLESLALLLSECSGQQLVFASPAKILHVSPHTIKAWVNILNGIYFGFRLRPWYRNIRKALRKEPKWYLRDWSGISDPGARAETLVACHLLKAVETWTDSGMGGFDLRYVRDKEKREIDFLVLRDGDPWILIEVKLSDTRLSPNLEYFQKQLRAPHAMQVVADAPWQEIDCFNPDFDHPIIVSARTFLSQLI